MKLLFALLTLAPAAAFVPATFGRHSFALASSRPDSKAAVDAALEASKTFGATSPEARLAWENVEEMDASDNSAAFQGSLDTECLTDEEFSSACKDYSTKLGDLEKLLAENGPKMEMMKSLAQEMSAIKLVVAESKPASDSPQVRAALANAKEVSAKFGAASPEAAVAWEELEEIASSGLSNAMGSRLDQECLVESAMEACQALEELDRVINLQKSNGEYSF